MKVQGGRIAFHIIFFVASLWYIMCANIHTITIYRICIIELLQIWNICAQTNIFSRDYKHISLYGEMHLSTSISRKHFCKSLSIENVQHIFCFLHLKDMLFHINELRVTNYNLLGICYFFFLNRVKLWPIKYLNSKVIPFWLRLIAFWDL